jgi:heat shock protein HtpX
MALFQDLLVANRIKSVLLIIMFIIFYTLMIFGVAVAALALALDFEALRSPWALVAIALASHIVAVILAIVAYVSGPALVLNVSRASLINPDSDPQLHDLVEEMALAAGLPVPKIYLVHSTGLNAFAVGYEGRGAVVLTQGLRDRLTRDQIQGVIAHEIARMENQDLHLMTLVVGLVGLTVLVAHLFWGLVEEAAAVKNSWPLIVVAVFSPLILPVLVISPILGRIIQLAVSRQRQFLADAEAARLTRYPEALAQALEIMHADDSSFDGSTLATAPLFIVPPMSKVGPRAGGSGPWWSHPSVEERVARLRSIGTTE